MSVRMYGEFDPMSVGRMMINVGITQEGDMIIIPNPRAHMYGVWSFWNYERHESVIDELRKFGCSWIARCLNR